MSYNCIYSTESKSIAILYALISQGLGVMLLSKITSHPLKLTLYVAITMYFWVTITSDLNPVA